MFESFIFEGFSPTETQQAFANRTLWQLDEEAPSDSSLSGQIRLTEKGFEGKLLINSSMAKFSARVVGNDPDQVITNLCDKVRSQLCSWRKRRFDNHIPQYFSNQWHLSQMNVVLAE